MQKNASIYTRSRMGIDFRVWLTLLITIILSALLLGFRIATDEVCYKINLDLKGIAAHEQKNTFFVGEKVAFIAGMKDAREVVWDFGDGTAAVTGASVSHNFTQEGNFLVTATVNGKCTESVNLHVSKVILSGKAVNSAGTTVADGTVIGKDYATTGELSIYQSAIAGASYEWTIENDAAFPAKNEDKVSYSFTEPGSYVIKLKLDHDENKVYRKTVLVTESPKQSAGAMVDELPPLPLPPPPKAVSENTDAHTGSGSNSGAADASVAATANKKVDIIPDPMFTRFFQSYIEGRGSIEDIAQYLCDGMSTKVRGNGKFYSNLTLFAEELKGKKGMLGLGGKRKIKSVKAQRDGGNQCVWRLDIEYK